MGTKDIKEKKIVKNALHIPNIGVIDKRDGEIMEDEGTWMSKAESDRRKKHFAEQNKKNEKEKMKLLDEHERIKKETGITEKPKEKITTRFIWSYFETQQKLFPNLKPQDISRLIYLSTYIENETNALKYGGKKVKLNDINNIMNLERDTYKRWINKMIECGYIETDKDDNVFINNSYFSRGKMQELGDKRSMRMFITAIREMYLNMSAAEHKRMGILFQMIPYMNPYFNCLAKNQFAKSKDELEPMTLGELAVEMGYTPRHARNIGNEILQTRFGADRKRIAIAVALNNLKPEDHIILINSKLFFGGTIDGYNDVNNWFDNYENKEVKFLYGN